MLLLLPYRTLEVSGDSTVTDGSEADGTRSLTQDGPLARTQDGRAFLGLAFKISADSLLFSRGVARTLSKYWRTKGSVLCTYKSDILRCSSLTPGLLLCALNSTYCWQRQRDTPAVHLTQPQLSRRISTQTHVQPPRVLAIPARSANLPVEEETFVPRAGTDRRRERMANLPAEEKSFAPEAGTNRRPEGIQRQSL